MFTNLKLKIQILMKEININIISFLILIFLLIILILYRFIFDKSENKINNYDDFKKCLLKFDSDKIYEFSNILTDKECDEIINISKTKLKRSHVIGENKHEISKGRTSTTTFLKETDNILTKSTINILKKIDNKLENIIKIPSKKYEPLQIVNYKPGEFYKSHYDACDPKKDNRCIEDYKKGLRFATFIIYLNDNIEGGETEFPLLNLKIKPEKGKGVLFFNLNDDLLGRKHTSKHGGLPPTKGNKWMCNKWIRLNDWES